MVFQQNLIEKAYFIAKMSGPTMVRPASFWLLESALCLDQINNITKLYPIENLNLLSYVIL